MELLMILGIAVVMGILYRILGWNSGGETQKITSEKKSVVQKDATQVKQLLGQMGVQILEEAENEYTVKYQGGTFFFWYKPDVDSVCLVYPNFEQLKFEDAQKAMLIANGVNAQSLWWICYLRTADEGEREKPIYVSLSYTASLAGEQQALVEILQTIMQSAFSVARDFCNKFDEEQQKGTDLNVQFVQNDFSNKMAFIRNRLEIGHGNVEQEQNMGEDALELPALLKLYEDIDWGCPRELRIMVDGKYNVVNDANEMVEFDIRYFIKHQCSGHLQEASILACFENNDLQINLYQVDGCTEKSLFYQVTLNRIGHTSNFFTNNPDTYLRNALVEIRLTDAKEDYWEAKFMIDDARDKQKAGKYGELTDEQQMVLSLTGESMQFDMYWGKRYYNAKCYYQALTFFRGIYAYFRRNWKDVTEEVRQTYYEVCFYIGFIYMELNLREKAFYFLNLAKMDSRINYMMEYINCLCNMHDPFVIEYIRSYIDRSVELLNGEMEGDEGIIAFYNFLNRRLAYMLIEIKEYDEAEKHLNDLIKNGIDVDFAKDELKYLNAKRERNND